MKSFLYQNNYIFIIPASKLIYNHFLAKMELLSNIEKIRFNAFKRTEDKMRFLIGRLVLREILKDYAHIQPNQCQFYYNLHGKIFLVGDSCCFNISHSNKLVFIALSLEQNGVDVEYHDSMHISEINEIADKCYSSQEKSYIFSKSNKQKAFYDIWVKKEAYLKLKSTGLNENLHKICTVDLTKKYQFTQFNYKNYSNAAIFMNNKKNIYIKYTV